ncbi:MAG: hypothetical protein LBP95_02750 [Deltaproteobacteria bacterium]|jgi:hypothetical protein|nr:hypothetical protein [Deltaproteobacteria bacterium]
MKIRLDFVSNSSSTSFLVSLKGEMSKKNLFKRMGIANVPWLVEAFDDLYNCVMEADDITIRLKEEEAKAKAKEKVDEEEEEDILYSVLDGYSDKTMEIVRELLDKGRVVFEGFFSDYHEGTAVSGFFCNSRVTIHTDDFFFDCNSGGY